MTRYLRIFLLVMLVIVALTAACNVLVDPYRMSGSTLLQHWAAIKPYFADNHVLGKPFAMRQRQPRALIFGTSRENHGIDPEHRAWPVPPHGTYNLAMDAANMAEIEQLFEHASRVTELQEVVIALDFLNMFDSSVQGADNFDTSLLVSDAQSPPATWLNAARYFASWPMLRDSVRTLWHQDPAQSEFGSDGRRNALVFERAAARFGQHHMFEFSEMRYLRARLPLPAARRYVPQDSHGPTLRHLARILDRAAAEHINVRLYITPVHARQLEVYRMLGLWDTLEDWKRNVRSIACGLTDRSAGSLEGHSEGAGLALRHTQQSFALWDFADYSNLTTEPVPAAGDVQARMQWYWESSHYKKPLGDRVLDRIFEVPQGLAPADFGLLLNNLTAAELEQHLQAIRERGAAYRVSHPQDVADLQRLAAQIGGS